MKKDKAEFRTFIDEWESGARKSNTQQRKEDKMRGAKLILDEKGWKVYLITTYEAAVKYGAGTTWCITGRYGNEAGGDPNGKYYFDNYRKNYNLEGYYYIFDTENRAEASERMNYKGGDYVKYCALIDKDTRRLVNLTSGVQDRDITRLGIPNIPKDRQIELVPGTKIPFYNIFEVKDGVLYKLNNIISPVEILNFPDEVEKIGNLVADGNKGLGGIFTGNNCKVIGTGAFINSSVTGVVTYADEIGGGAFMGCSKLQEVSIENSNLKVVQARCFAYCEHLRRVHLPDSVEEIADDAFEGCPSNLEIISNSEAVKQYIETHPDWEPNVDKYNYDDEDDEDVVPLF